eukprot:12905647-Prorocentrum_lima.AAC.1
MTGARHRRQENHKKKSTAHLQPGPARGDRLVRRKLDIRPHHIFDEPRAIAGPRASSEEWLAG